MKPIAIQLDKKRNLFLDMNAMAEFEEVTGTSFFELGENFTAKKMRALLWACLIDDDPNLTLKDVGKMINASNMKEIENALSSATTKFNGEPSETSSGN
jgi:hypothetical protein